MATMYSIIYYISPTMITCDYVCVYICIYIYLYICIYIYVYTYIYVYLELLKHLKSIILRWVLFNLKIISHLLSQFFQPGLKSLI